MLTDKRATIYRDIRRQALEIINLRNIFILIFIASFFFIVNVSLLFPLLLADIKTFRLRHYLCHTGVYKIKALPYLVEVLVEPIHKEQEQLLRVLLVVASKLLVDLAYGNLEIPWTDAFVQTSPKGLHDHTKLLGHFPFMAKDV